MFSENLHKLFNYLYWTLYVTVTAVLLWGADKGFDLSDEGFTMLFYNPNQEGIAETYPFFSVLGKLLSAFNPDVFFYRILRLVLLITSSFVFTYGLTKWVKQSFGHLIFYSLSFFYPIIGLFTLLSYSFAYQTLNYNALTLFFTQLVSGFFLLSLTRIDTKNTFSLKKIALQTLTGFGLCLLFYVKFPSAILLFFTFSFILFIYHQTIVPNSLFQSIKFLLPICFAAFLCSIIFYFFSISPLRYVQTILSPTGILPGHNTQDILIHNIEDYYENFLKFIVLHLNKALLWSLALWLLYRNKFYKMAAVACTALVYTFISYVIHFEYYKAGTSYFYSASVPYRLIALMSILFIVSLGFDLKTKSKSDIEHVNYSSLLIAFVLLYCLPFICSLGTNVALSVHIIQFSYSWMVLFALTIMLFFRQKPFDHFLKLFLLVLSIMASSQIIYAFVYEPYRVSTPLTEQTHRVKHIRKAQNLKFDSETTAFLEDLLLTLKTNNQTTDNQPIIVLYNYPGLTYLLGGVSPGAPWYFDPGYENAEQFHCRFIQSSAINNLKNTVFLLESNYTISESFIECLMERGIDFNNNYILVDSIKKPFEEGNIKIYLPQHKKQYTK